MIFNKTLIRVFVATLFFNVAISAHAQDLFKEIAPLLLAPEKPAEQQTSDYKINLTNAQQTKQIAIPKLCINRDLKPLTKNEIIKTYLMLFEAQEVTPYASGFNEKICSINELKKLNVLAGTQSSTTTSLKGVIPTKTAAGEIVKTVTLATPTTAINVLEERQKKIEFFLNNPEILQKIQAQLQIIGTNEAAFLTYFKTLDDIEQNALNEFYFRFKKLNNSRTGLNAFYLISRTSTLAGMLPMQIWQQVFAHAGAEFKNQPGSYLEKLSNLIKNVPQIIVDGAKDGAVDLFQQHNPKTNTLSRVNQDESFTIIPTGKTNPSWGDLALFREHTLTKGVYPKNKFKKIGIKTLANIIGFAPILYTDLVSAQVANQTIQQHKKFLSVLRNFHTKLNAGAKIAQAYKTIYTLLEGTPLHCSELESLFFESNTSKRGTLSKLLHSKPINKRFSAIKSEWGELLATNHQVEEEKNTLVKPLYKIGEIDLFAATAQSILSAENAKRPWCFTTYFDVEKSNEPYFSSKNFWNPLVAEKEVVLNSIVLDPKKSRNILFTGPNGSGKSTNTKAILFNIILSQTLGITFSQSFGLTPYTKIMTAHEEQEDIAKSMSSFMAEKMRIDTICEKIISAGKTDRIFFFMDEPIKGTVEEAAGKIILEACLKIAKSSQVNTLVITHTKAPLAAEKLTDGQFRNYFVDVLENKDGTFNRTFVLKEGTADWWFSNPTTRKSFIDFLSNNINS